MTTDVHSLRRAQGHERKPRTESTVNPVGIGVSHTCQRGGTSGEGQGKMAARNDESDLESVVS